jgi:hypothetical protein
MGTGYYGGGRRGFGDGNFKWHQTLVIFLEGDVVLLRTYLLFIGFVNLRFFLTCNSLWLVFMCSVVALGVFCDWL